MDKSGILVTKNSTDKEIKGIITLSKHHNILVDNISDEGCTIVVAPVGAYSYITNELDLKISELPDIIGRFCYLVDRSDHNSIHSELIDQNVLHCQIDWAILSLKLTFDSSEDLSTIAEVLGVNFTIHCCACQLSIKTITTRISLLERKI